MKTTALASLALVPSLAFSQASDASASVVRLDKYVVVASPIVGETQVDALASRVTKVTERQLLDLNARDLQSALREVPGVIVSHFNQVGSFGGGDGGGVFIRGMGSARPGAEIQLSIDGIPSYNSVWAHPILDMLNVDIARSIDVYKGAQPVLYGNMAFAVVDIAPKFQEIDGRSGKVSLSAGSFGTWSAVAESGFRKEALDTYVLASARASDGDRPNSDGRLLSGYLRLGWTLNPHWSARVVYDGTSNYADDPGPDASLVPASQLYGNGRFEDDNDLLVATLSHRYEAAEGTIKPYWSRGKLNWTGQYNATTGQNEDVTVTEYDHKGVKTQEKVRPWRGAEILGGLDYDSIGGKYRTVTAGVAGAFPKRTVHIVSPYASLGQSLELPAGWTLRPSFGARYFDHSLFSDEWAPQGGLVLGNGRTELHVSGARGVNYPGFFVMAYPPGANQHDKLSAETVTHWEAGLGQRLGETLKIELAIFRDDGANRIVTSYPPYPPVWKNLNGFRSEGAEVSVSVSPSRTLSLFASATAMNTSPGDLPYAPDWSGSVGANWRFLERFRLGVDAQYVGAQSVLSRNRDVNAANATRLGSYALLNARLAYEFSALLWGLDGECFVAGENLGDADYQQKYGYPMPGLNGSLGFSVRF